jgi:hypothetical protein
MYILFKWLLHLNWTPICWLTVQEVVAMVNQYDYMLGNLLNRLEQSDNKQR